jgi:hypothetical protein
MKKLFIAALMIFCIACGTVYAAKIEAKWQPVDDPDVKGYKVYYKPFDEDLYPKQPICDTKTTFCKANIERDGFFIVRAYDKNFLESENSNEVFEGGISAPGKVNNFTIFNEKNKIIARWALNTEPDVKLYKVYYRPIGQQEYDLSNPFCESAAAVCSADGRFDGYFMVVAEDYSGLVSAQSEEIFDGTISPPKPPNELIIYILGSMDAKLKNINTEIKNIAEAVKQMNLKGND